MSNISSPSKDERSSVNNGGETPCRKQYRRKRIAFTVEQLERLQQTFLHDQYPGIKMREELSQELLVSESRIQVWFQNRRSKWRRHQNNQLNTPTYLPDQPAWSYPVQFYNYVNHGRNCGVHHCESLPEHTACTSSNSNLAKCTSPITNEAKSSAHLVSCVSSLLSSGHNHGHFSTIDVIGGCNDLHLSGSLSLKSRSEQRVSSSEESRSSDELLAARGLVSVGDDRDQIVIKKEVYA